MALDDDATGHEVRFAKYGLDPERLELRREDELVDLGPAPTRALVYLAMRPGRLITREELYEHLWPRGGVDVDRALNSYIRQIRRALGERAGENRFIRTHPGRGYRFVAKTTDGHPGRRLPLPAWAAVALGGLVTTAIVAGFLLSTATDAAGPTREAEIGHAAPPLDTELRIAHLTGLELLARPSPTRRAEAVEHFRVVTTARPDFGPAHAGLAESLVWAGKLEEAAPAARVALALEPESVRAHRALGTAILVTDWAWEAAERVLRHAVSLDRYDATSRVALAYLLVAAGRDDEARAQLDSASALEPTSPIVTGDIGTLYGWIGDHDRALELCRRTLAVEPGAPWGLACVRGAQAAMGIEPTGRSSPEDRQAPPNAPAVDAPPATHLARATRLVRQGRLEDALDELERSGRDRELGYVAIGAIPALRPLRGDPRFEELLRHLFGSRAVDADEG